MSEYEAVINEIGSFGPAQRQVFILVSLFEAPAVWGLLVHPVFASRKVPWSCDYINGTNLDISQSNITDWMAGNCTLFEASQCENLTYSGDYTSVVSEWDMICERSHLASLITTLQMVGGFLGAFLAGQISDIYGRKKVLIGVFSIFCLSSLLSAFANSWILYLVLKFIVGAAVSGTMVVNFSLTMEFVTPEWRTFCGTIGFWNVGVMLMALIAYLIPNWRYMTMTVSLLGLPLLICWWFIPESPRWLLLKGRRKEAEVILSQMAKRNKKPEPDYSKLQAFIEKQQHFRDESRKYTYWDLCRNFQMTRTTAIILYMWFACSCVYYGTTLGAGKLHGDVYLNLFFSGLVEIPGLLFVLAFNNRIGRRKTLCILLLVGGASCLCVLLVDLFGGVHLRWLSTMLSLIGKSGVSGAWAAVLISSAEFFPTVVRNIGLASSSMSSRIGSVVAPMMADLDEYHMSVPYVIYGVLGLSCGILCFFIPETLNHPLPDSLPPGEYCSCIRGYDLPMDDASLEAITKESNGVVYLDKEDKVITDNTDNKELLTDAERQEDDKVNV